MSLIDGPPVTIFVAGDIYRFAGDARAQGYRWHQEPNVQWLRQLLRASLSSDPAIQICILDHETLGLQPDGFAPDHDFPVEEWWLAMSSRPVERRLRNRIEQIVADHIVIGFETPANLAEVFAGVARAFIDMEIAPIRFMDDLLLLFTSNSAELNAIATSMAVTNREIRWHLGLLIGEMGSPSLDLIGKYQRGIGILACQTKVDRSLISDGKILNLADFGERVLDLASDHDVILISPHPLAGMEIAGLEALRTIPGLRITLANSYRMLASGEIRTLSSISSSLLAEAEYFDVRVKRFAPPDQSMPRIMIRAQDFGSAIADEIARIAGASLPALKAKGLPPGPALKQVSRLNWGLSGVHQDYPILPALELAGPGTFFPMGIDLATALTFGWYPVEDWGVWCGPVGVINFVWPENREEPIHCILNFLVIFDVSRKVELWIDGICVAAADLRIPADGHVSFQICRPSRPGPIQLWIVTPEPRRPADLIANGDYRLLGAGLLSLDVQ